MPVLVWGGGGEGGLLLVFQETPTKKGVTSSQVLAAWHPYTTHLQAQRQPA